MKMKVVYFVLNTMLCAKLIEINILKIYINK